MPMHADVDLIGLVLFSVVGMKLGLDTLGTLHGVHYRGKVHQETIAHGLDDVAVVGGDGLFDDLVMHGQQS